MKITTDTAVPIGWVFSGLAVILGVGITGAFTGAFWVFTVNVRLARIEDKLGIVPYKVVNNLITQVYASDKQK